MMVARPVTADSGKPPPQALGDGDQVRLHARMFDGKHPAGSRNSALHFVRDQHDAVLVAEAA